MTMNPPRRGFAIALAGMFVALLTGGYSAFQDAPPGAAQAARTAEGEAQLATIKQYCAGCHNDRAKVGGVSFEGLTAESAGQSIAQHGELFEKAVRKLRG